MCGDYVNYICMDYKYPISDVISASLDSARIARSLIVKYLLICVFLSLVAVALFVFLCNGTYRDSPPITLEGFFVLFGLFLFLFMYTFFVFQRSFLLAKTKKKILVDLEQGKLTYKKIYAYRKKGLEYLMSKNRQADGVIWIIFIDWNGKEEKYKFYPCGNRGYNFLFRLLQRTT